MYSIILKVPGPRIEPGTLHLVLSTQDIQELYTPTARDLRDFKIISNFGFLKFNGVPLMETSEP